MSRHPQRNDIQLLRGLAVIAVMLFHVDFWWIPGGFLGVDIFFVISGFVITRKIMSELEVGSFTLGEFYLKRIRRILPAAGATILAVLIAGVLVSMLLTGCGPQNGNQRPADEVLKKGIAQLIQSFESTYPKLKNWDDAAVRAQISKKLPIGNSTEAGWHLRWPSAIDGELSQL